MQARMRWPGRLGRGALAVWPGDKPCSVFEGEADGGRASSAYGEGRAMSHSLRKDRAGA